MGSMEDSGTCSIDNMAFSLYLGRHHLTAISQVERFLSRHGRNLNLVRGAFAMVHERGDNKRIVLAEVERHTLADEKELLVIQQGGRRRPVVLACVGHFPQLSGFPAADLGYAIAALHLDVHEGNIASLSR